MKSLHMHHLNWQKIILQILLLMLFSSQVFAKERFFEFKSSHDPELQIKLENLLQEKGLWKHSQKEKLAMIIIDLSAPAAPRMAEINGAHMMYAASLPKLAILVGAFIQIQRDQLTLDDALWKDLNLMIRFSSNPAATRVLDLVGRDTLVSILQEPDYRFYDSSQGGGLWVGKAYAKTGAYNRDPLKNLSHAASPIQAARVYYLLVTGKLLNPELSKKMLQVLGNPGINHKLVKGIKKDYPDAKIYRKSGSWSNFHADSALLEVAGKYYIIVGLVENPKGGDWLAELAVPLLEIMLPDSN